ncbi:GEgh16 protein [Hypoxylon rubiginosum]|uniref:GEgh16 protein n=1 Tax=Hypoxylon rubiginosum TaxID=110542 RepID=A0ACB9YP01_9PEZI|nr:GEgh16 protein [Hypoxylon rubiginosum]
MFSLRQILTASAVLAVAHGQGVILKAQGAKGSPASLGLQVDPDDSADANFISQTEIVTNVVNECGRTLQAGNIDIGASTEDALAADQVTQVTKGSSVQVTIREVNQTGAGPYTCDMDPTGNSIGATGQTNLTTTESKPDKNGDITLKVAMPKDLACIGSSTGDVCTVRCRNANEFGGCFAVQQTDTTPAENTPQNIETAQTLQGITQQVQQNIADLPAAANALAGAGSSDAEIGTAIVEGIQATDPATDGLAQDQAGDANTGNSNTGNANTNTGNNNGNGRGGRGKNRGNNNRRRNVRRLR